MVHLIYGYGEVGRSLGEVIGKHYWMSRSGGDWKNQVVDVIHICVPYSEDFEGQVNYFQQILPKALIIVHSSVPVGTCDALGVVHSPIRGVHPHLEEGIRTFVKYFGGKKAEEAALIFYYLGLKTKTFPKAKTSEALKLWDTTQYGTLIMLEKIIHAWCKENKVNFDDIYTHANQDYNEGYIALGRPEVVRPWLKHVPGPIGGHCVLPNAKLLGFDMDVPEELL